MKELHTPAGEIFLEREDGMRIPFSAQPNPYRPAYGALLPAETLLLTAEAAHFEAGYTYRLRLSTGQLCFCGADEDWQALCALHGGYGIGIGVRDPNDGALLHKDWNKRQYTLHIAEDGYGFTLCILEALDAPIVFHAAWLRADGRCKQACEAALGLWLV